MNACSRGCLVEARHICSEENPTILLSQVTDGGSGVRAHNARLIGGSKNLVRHDSDILSSISYFFFISYFLCLISCFLFLISYYLFLVSYFLFLISCFLFLISYFLFLISSFLFLISYFLFLLSYFLFLIS